MNKLILSPILTPILSIAAISLVACTPSVSKEIDLSTLQVVKKSAADKSSQLAITEAAVFVDLFLDARDSEVIVIKGKTESKLRNDPGKIVKEAISTALANEGFIITDSAPLIISGSLTKWQAHIESGFSSKIKSEAKISIEVFDPANKPVYRANYDGYSEVSNPSLNSEDVKGALSRSLGEAVKQIAVDKKLLVLLNSF